MEITVPRLPLEDFFRNPEKAAYQISPDGNYLSLMMPFQNRMNIFIQKRGAEEVVCITNEIDRDIADYFWKDDRRIIYFKDFNGDENYHVVTIDRDGQNQRDLTPFEGVRAEIIDDLPTIDTEIIIGLNKRDPQVFDVYRLNVSTGEMELIAKNPGNIIDWVTDHDGKIRVAIASDGANSTLLYRETETTPFRPIMTISFRETFHPLMFTFDNRHIYAESNLGRDKSAIVKYDIANGKELEILFEHPEVDVDSLDYSEKRKVLTYLTYTTWKNEYHFLDSLFKNCFERLRRHLPTDELFVTDMNKAEDLWIVRRYSDRSRGSYYLYETELDRLTKLADISPWLKEDEMCQIKPIVYQTRDGLTIHGYLTLPQTQKAAKLPVVVIPHGGPWARDYWAFDSEVQFLANRGFAVLQMNFRGSTGYGRKFLEVSFKQWGLTMQDDITDGVNWLIDQGIAEPRKVAIYGGSYGGYATLAGLAFTPALYACGVDYVGVSNLFTFLQTIPPYWKPQLEMFYEMVGHPEKDAGQLRATSPVFHADKIRAPLFVAQGAKDPRVNIAESDQIVTALRKRGVQVEYMIKENEGHGFDNEENRFDFYQAMERFLEKHLS